MTLHIAATYPQLAAAVGDAGDQLLPSGGSA